MKRNTLFLSLLIISFAFTACNNSDKTIIKYISFNIRNCRANDGDNSWLNRRNGTLNMLRTEKPTIFGVQEAYIEQLKFIEDSMPQYARIGVGRDDGMEGGEYSAIFYLKDKYKMLNHGDFWLNQTPSLPVIGWDAACIRIVTWGHFKVINSDKNFFVFNTHLDHVGKVARKQSILLIINKIKEITKNQNATVILSGDFNSNTENPIFKPLKAMLNDSRKYARQTDHKATFNDFGQKNNSPSDAVNIIDYIFYKNANVIKYKTLDENYGVPYISDHYPIEAKIVF